MKEFIESLSAADLKKVAKKFGIDNTQPRIGIVTKLVEYTEANATTQTDIETFLVKKEKAPKEIPHTITAEDLQNNPELVEENIKEGDEITIPIENIEVVQENIAPEQGPAEVNDGIEEVEAIEEPVEEEDAGEIDETPTDVLDVKFPEEDANPVITQPTIDDEIEDKLEEVIDELKDAYEDVVGDAKEVLSATAHKWYKYLEYMKGKKSWEDFFKYLDSKAQNSFKFKEHIQEIKAFLKIK